MAEREVRYALAPEGGVAEVVLSRPQRGNALTPEVARSLGDAVTTAGSEARCVVLRSEGPNFCTGADMAFLSGLAGETPEEIREIVYRNFQGLIRAIVECPVPVIAAAQGGAVGAGADLLLACDLVVASEQAWIQESWIGIGATSALAGAFHLARTVGRYRALDLLLSARRLSAEDAHALGIVQAVVGADQLRDTAVSLAQRIAAADPEAVQATKSLVRLADGPGREEALTQGARLQSDLLGRAVVHERVTEIRRRLERS